jgi:hypothetical protein
MLLFPRHLKADQLLRTYKEDCLGHPNPMTFNINHVDLWLTQALRHCTHLGHGPKVKKGSVILDIRTPYLMEAHSNPTQGQSCLMGKADSHKIWERKTMEKQERIIIY